MRDLVLILVVVAALIALMAFPLHSGRTAVSSRVPPPVVPNVRPQPVPHEPIKGANVAVNAGTQAAPPANPSAAGIEPDPELFELKKPSWHTLIEETFDSDPPKNARLTVRDKALSWQVEKGEARIFGVTSDKGWAGDSAILDVRNERGRKVEVSVDFRVEIAEGWRLIALLANTTHDTAGRTLLCMYLVGRPDRQRYAVQMAYMKMPIIERGESRSLPPLGNETTTFHTMRMVLNRDKSLIEYFVDDQRLTWLRYQGRIGPITSLRADIQTPHQGKAVDIRYDNLRVRVFGDVFSKQLAAVGRAEWKRRDPEAEHLIWFRDARGLGLADLEARRITHHPTLVGIEKPQVTAVLFGPECVWVGTTRGLVAWDRKRGFWQRVAVGARHLEANIENASLAGGKLRVVVRHANGKTAGFEYVTATKKWREVEP